MAAVLALFDLNIETPITQFWAGLTPDFAPLCDAFCTRAFNNVSNVSAIIDVLGNASAPLPLSNCSLACEGARFALGEGLTPALLPKSQVHVNLRLEGLAAMYAFCIGVLISLTTGVWVDTLDDALRDEEHAAAVKAHGCDTRALNGPRDRRVAAALTRRAAATPPPQPLAPTAAGGLGSPLLPPGGAQGSAAPSSQQQQQRPPPAAARRQAVSSDSCGLEAQEWGLSDAGSGGGAVAASGFGSSLGRRWRRTLARLERGMHVGLVLLQLAFNVGSVTQPAFERAVAGSMGKLLQDVGIDFTSYISVRRP